MKIATLLGFALFFSACTPITADNIPPFDSSPGIVVTDSDSYDAELIVDGLERVVLNIPYEIRNTSGVTLYQVGCNEPPQPTLEKYIGDQWVYAYAPIRLLCLSPPFRISAGRVQYDTLRVIGFFPGQSAGPEFETSIEGWYRLKAEIYTSLTEDRSPVGKDMLPLAYRVSNTFEIK